LSTPRDVGLELAKRGKGGLAAHFDLNRMMKLEENFGDNE